eukprot:414591-Pelagomonas_calceolata.AAC.1
MAQKLRDAEQQLKAVQQQKEAAAHEVQHLEQVQVSVLDSCAQRGAGSLPNCRQVFCAQCIVMPVTLSLNVGSPIVGACSVASIVNILIRALISKCWLSKCRLACTCGSVFCSQSFTRTLIFERKPQCPSALGVLTLSVTALLT